MRMLALLTSACVLGLMLAGCSAPPTRKRGVIDYRAPGTKKRFDRLQQQELDKHDAIVREAGKNRDRYLNDR